MRSRQLKTIAVFAVIIILSFHHNFKALHKGWQRYNRNELDQIAKYEKRFSDLKAYLQNSTVVGYVSDFDDKSNDDGLAYGMAQYVLAPVILVRGINRNFIIGNFQSAKPDIKAYEKSNISLTVDFGNGVMLFERMEN
jgi:hypothetical protein